MPNPTTPDQGDERRALRTFLTNDLEGVALAYAVAKAEGRTGKLFKTASGLELIPFAYVRRAGGPRVILDEAQFLFDFDLNGYYSPHNSWGMGGPIIARESIAFVVNHNDECPPELKYTAFIRMLGSGRQGPTHLVAAMRAFVASKLGDTVEIPEMLG